MEKMLKNLKAGENVFFARSECEYEEFTEWLCDNGWSFSRHFESGEAFQRKMPDGFLRVVEVVGL
jgi:hypothetical protein